MRRGRVCHHPCGGHKACITVFLPCPPFLSNWVVHSPEGPYPISSPFLSHCCRCEGELDSERLFRYPPEKCHLASPSRQGCTAFQLQRVSHKTEKGYYDQEELKEERNQPLVVSHCRLESYGQCLLLIVLTQLYRLNEKFLAYCHILQIHELKVCRC